MYTPSATGAAGNPAPIGNKKEAHIGYVPLSLELLQKAYTLNR